MKEARHGTAEFRIEQGDALRVMFAFFLKSESVVVRSVWVGAADSEKRGLDQSWRAAKPAKRAKRGAR
jgi:putative component of toxin-antitoxin plasmid stabilization module